MFKKLLQFEVFYQYKQRAFPLFVLLFTALGIFVGRNGFAPTGLNFNAGYQVNFHTSIFTLGSVFIIMFFAISAMLRDKQHLMEGIIFSTSITKANYFWSRFAGTFIFSVLAFSPFILGYIIGNYFFDLDPERVADFKFTTYFQPWLYFILPNIFICTALVFSISTLTKNSTATYVSAVFIYMLYFVSSIFLNSPIMAQSVPASPESMIVAAIADPFGVSAFLEQTQYWTPFQKNTQMLSFSGYFLINRLVWVGIALVILLSTYGLFSFRKISKKVKKNEKITIDKTPYIKYKPIETFSSLKAQLLAFKSILKLELKSVFKSLPFIAILLMWVFIVFSELYSTVIGGGEYGVSNYPFTYLLIELIVDPLTLFSILLIVFYGGDIVWRERSANFNFITDATPVKNWVIFGSKFSALLSLPFILITIGVLMCMLFQISLGYTNFEFSLYGSLYYYYGVQLVVFCMIAIFVNNLVKSKYIGMGLFLLIAILSLKSDVLGLEHPLTSLGFMPRTSYNTMDGFNGVSSLYNHLSIYWLSFGMILMLISFKIWNRGVVTKFTYKLKQLKQPATTLLKGSFIVSILLFFTAGSLVFYNKNIVNEYVNSTSQLDFRENYEKKFKQYEVLARPITTSRKTIVDIYPTKRSYSVIADYMIKNKSDKPMSQVFITERVDLKNVTIENATLAKHDTVFGTYLFQFDAPLQPNDSVRFNYEFTKSIKGYDNDISIVNNGSYITHNSFEPILGYSAGLELRRPSERKKRNLPKRTIEVSTAAHIVSEEEKNEKIPFETIVSTNKNQTAISSGDLIKAWAKDDRNYYHYKSNKKIVPMIGYFSAAYQTKKTNYKDIEIEQYYDAKQPFNINEIENSIKVTLDYCQENFGAYMFNHLRMVEVPSYWSFGGFAHPGVISMVEDRLYLSDVRNPERFNVVAKRTIHEVAHQWWGHTLSSKPVAGGALLVEGLAKYTEAVVLEKTYGKGMLVELIDNARGRYFSGRSFSGSVEPPAYLVTNQSYISYGKSLNIMLALRDLIGETKVNAVLKSLTDKDRATHSFNITTIDFLNALYQVTTEEQQALINDWFKKVITYDVGIENASYKELTDGTFEITAKVSAKRFETLSNGESKEVNLNEAIKIGVFSSHPSKVKKEESSLLYYQSNKFKNGITEIKIIVKDRPTHISIDPYGTRSDENLSDNTFSID
ncbi:M1 family aminopeptidase [Pontimicrobium sp. IMCC45349]|uniref:ABC transporter permease/M1 family aminopeptidase n=1 Tax=Pontimicrobium sp. IMCC45349 TaxID=3391574 RepID=UPI0039A07230